MRIVYPRIVCKGFVGGHPMLVVTGEEIVPYKSMSQRKLMRAVAKSPAFAKKVGIPQSVGKKFEAHKEEPMAKKRRKPKGGY